MRWSRRRFLLAASAAAIGACTQQPSRTGDALVPLYANPAKNVWPPEFLELPSETQTMYRYVVANRDILQYMPCFCGCVAGGHQSNFDCYVREVLTDGGIRLDTMSFG